jgi:hypothetical protein
LSVGLSGKYDVFFDAAGNNASLAEAFRVAADRAAGARKVVVEPNSWPLELALVDEHLATRKGFHVVTTTPVV